MVTPKREHFADIPSVTVINTVFELDLFEANLDRSFSPICRRTMQQMREHIRLVTSSIESVEQNVAPTLESILGHISPCTPPWLNSPRDLSVVNSPSTVIQIEDDGNEFLPQRSREDLTSNLHLDYMSSSETVVF
ncbi:hypothetical protein CDAR_493101 [Caerostris darwini]|uniref:Uncharacterized protein n=1 Tax=Caerostris darwini TaxID=1538125 RepID=A0AAV4TTQ4_9ARAC|nr:hypothetical protein CDAR_493101 [Caerostris darwini]